MEFGVRASTTLDVHEARRLHEVTLHNSLHPRKGGTTISLNCLSGPQKLIIRQQQDICAQMLLKALCRPVSTTSC